MGVLNPVTPVYNGALVSASNPLPVTLAGSGAVFPSVTFANLPAATTAWRTYAVSNAGTKGSVWMADGTRWKPLNGEAVLSTLDSPVTGIANSATIAFQYQMPVGLWQAKDVLRLYVTPSKSGTTDTNIMNFYVGTTGTIVGDQLLTSFAGTVLSATQREGGFIFDFRLDTATSVVPLARSDLGYGAGTTTAPPTAVTITSAAANSLWFSVAVRSNSTNDTVGLKAATLQLISSAN